MIYLNNINFDENTVNKLKDMMNNGNLNDVLSQIPPEMIQNFSSMMSQINQMLLLMLLHNLIITMQIIMVLILVKLT